MYTTVTKVLHGTWYIHIGIRKNIIRQRKPAIDTFYAFLAQSRWARITTIPGPRSRTPTQIHIRYISRILPRFSPKYSHLEIYLAVRASFFILSIVTIASRCKCNIAPQCRPTMDSPYVVSVPRSQGRAVPLHLAKDRNLGLKSLTTLIYISISQTKVP